MCSKRAIDPEKMAALARYEAANGHTDDPKVTKLKAPKARPSKAPPAPRRKKMSNLEYRDSIIDLYKLQHLKPASDVPAYDVTSPTRYPAAPMSSAIGSERLANVLRKYEWVMKPQGVTPADFKNWRLHSMMMTPEQLGELVRVTGRTIRMWESGKSEIPFAMWWVMHSTLQDPDTFLTRPGFHDFYIGYDHDKGEAQLCSYTWPDIRCSPTDLYFNRAALNQVGTLQGKVEQQAKEIGELTAENTRLRQMLKAGTVANELTAMHEHIGNLLKQMHTADIVSFPEPAPAASEVIEFPRQATA